MKRKKVVQYCSVFLVALGIVLNIQNAIADYGMNRSFFSLIAETSSNSNSSTNSNSNSNSNSNMLVPNGKVKIITRTNNCYSVNQTDVTQTLVFIDEETGEEYSIVQTWFKYSTLKYYDCELVDYDKVGWRPLCTEPNSSEAAGCSMTVAPPDLSDGGHWV